MALIDFHYQKNSGSKVIQIPEPRKHLLVKTRIKKIFACKIRNPTRWYPESKSRDLQSWKTVIAYTAVQTESP